ncbi:hypothetical protein PMAYCL1PPCAC_07434 [Pristionchus mayeri]|uniref:Uncharacterized protein n=1 Tax=Pristionchus mayeri TaxID=1317129 RepID=A0AAN4ZC36_9BILA|nr:hypothetical protein PMAYCL1PPCAC_07434 [Pristionchus mayeri]
MTESIYSAISKILKNYGAKTIGEAEYNKMLISLLDWTAKVGIRRDKSETQHLYGFFVDLIEAKCMILFDETNGPKMIRSLALIVHYDAFDKNSESIQVKGRIVDVLKKMKSTEVSFTQWIEAAKLDENADEDYRPMSDPPPLRSSSRVPMTLSIPSPFL